MPAANSTSTCLILERFVDDSSPKAPALPESCMYSATASGGSATEHQHLVLPSMAGRSSAWRTHHRPPGIVACRHCTLQRPLG